jgi:DNA-binding MarR family transcriptional regulator
MNDPSHRDIEIATTLRTVLHRLIRVLRRETRNDELLSPAERSILGLLYNQEMAPSELAQLEKVTAQSISQVINHLFELNYIHKAPSGDDKRKVLLSLTPAGKASVEERRQEKQEWLARALHERTSAEEKELLLKAMPVLTKLID